MRIIIIFIIVLILITILIKPKRIKHVTIPGNIKLKVDTNIVYDWTRFDYVNQWGKTIIHELKNSPMPQGIHFLDAMCGSGWLPLMVAHAFPLLDVVYSDISKEAVSLCKHNFQINQINNGYAYVGDLFQPTAKLKTWPKYSFLYPPQIQANYHNDDLAGPAISLFVHNQYTLFHRIARELPTLLNGQAVLWLGVDFELIQTVIHIFTSQNWICNHNYNINQKLPSALIQFKYG